MHRGSISLTHQRLRRDPGECRVMMYIEGVLIDQFSNSLEDSTGVLEEWGYPVKFTVNL